MTINLDTLRKTAEAEETQKWGGWAFEEDDFDGFCIYINDGDNFGRSYVAKDLTQGESEGESTAKFIATFDPPTVLAILSRLEQAEQAVVRVREVATAMANHSLPESPRGGAWETAHGAQLFAKDILETLGGDGRE